MHICGPVLFCIVSVFFTLLLVWNMDLNLEFSMRGVIISTFITINIMLGKYLAVQNVSTSRVFSVLDLYFVLP